MKKGIFTSVLCLVLLLAVLAAGVYGVNGFTAPIVAENERLAAEAAAEAERPRRKRLCSATASFCMTAPTRRPPPLR